MLEPRIIPVLLLQDGGLVKTVRFRQPRYIGDPINAVHIFNEKEVDELMFLDIRATAQRRQPDFEYLARISSECFMPFSYGGGVSRLDHVERILKLGAEKVVINSQALVRPDFVTEIARRFGSQAVIVSMDAKKRFFGGYDVRGEGGTHPSGRSVRDFAGAMERAGAGEILIQSIDRDGTFAGYDLTLIREVSSNVGVPVIACGGAAGLEDFRRALAEGHASAVAAGSFFVYHGKHQAVLITYPERAKIRGLFKDASISNLQKLHHGHVGP